MTLTFRAATPADVPAVVALVESAYRGEPSRAGWTTEADLLAGQRTDGAEVSAAVADPGGLVLLAETDGRLLGCCHLQARPGGVAYFGMFAVVPGGQGAGTGSALLAQAEHRAATELGARTVEMTVIDQRTELIAFYLRRGYARTGEQRPFPAHDPRFGRPLRDDLVFTVLARSVG